jgi:hypothetical protein
LTANLIFIGAAACAGIGEQTVKPQSTVLTIRKTSEFINQERQFYLYFRCFLDEFYRTDQSRRPGLIEEPPVDIPSFRYAVPYMAAAVHKLTNTYGLDSPPWIFEDRCFLPDGEPYFGLNAVISELRLYLMHESPAEFKYRNLFVPRNALTRA